MTVEKGYQQRAALHSGRISRRSALGSLQRVAVGGAGLAAAISLGCRQEGRPAAVSSGPAQQQPKRGGTLTHKNAQETGEDGYDPTTGTPLKAVTFRLFYQGLLGYHPRTYEVEPELARRWEQPSQTEYVFTLQPGVKWHNKPPVNGRELVADDIAFSLNRVRAPDPRFTSRSLLAGVDKVEAPDRSTVRITLKAPDAAFLSKLSADSFVALAPEVVERAGRLPNPEHAVGTGAFILTYAEVNVGAELVRNPDYWKPGLPYLDRIRTRQLGGNTPIEDQAWAAFLAGELDIVVIPGIHVKKYIADQGPGFTPAWFAEESGWWPSTPNTRVKPFDDKRIWRALRLLIDHEEWRTAWSEVWAGRGRNCSIFQPALETWDLPDEEYMKFLEWRQPKDQAVREALALLSAAGITRDTPLRFELSGSAGNYGQAANQLLQAQWRRLAPGLIEVQNRLYEGASYQDMRAQRQYVYGCFSNAASFNEPDVYFEQLYRSGASRNYWNYSDPQLDALIEKQRLIFNLQERKAAVKEIILYMIENHPAVIGSGRYFLNGVKPYVRNFFPEWYLNGRQYEQVWLDL